MASSTITPNGAPQGALVVLLADLVTKFNAVLAKLDADAGVTDTNYASLHAIAAGRITATETT